MIPAWNADEPVLMGVVNVTPDSFSDGGKYLQAERAIEHGLRLRDEGAGILDIGGESTRPGAAPVDAKEEIARVLPVLRGLKDCGVPLSVDTRNALTMKAAIDAGVSIVNDVSSLEHDPESLPVIASSEVFICLMHMKGRPQTMQDDPQYEDVLREIYGYLEGRIAACLEAGIDRNRIMIDPGIGFGKTLEQNLIILKNIDFFNTLDVPLLLGVSRKRFIGALCSGAGAEERMPGSIAACLSAYDKGVRLFRVHDVAETKQALTVYRATR